MRRAAAAVVLLLAAAACGGSGDGRRLVARASATPGAAAPASSPTPGGGGGGGGRGPATAPPAAPQPGSPPPPSKAPAGQPSQNPFAKPLQPGEVRRIWGTMRLEAELEPTCASVGTPMRLTVRTVQGAKVGASASYADNQPHDDYSMGEAVTGEFVWAWTIKPGVPEGLARVMVAAGKSGESGGAVMVGFEVRAPGRC